MRLFVLLTSLFFFSNSHAVERKLYVGKDSTEATMTFEAEVELKAMAKPTKAAAKDQVDLQITHLFGPMGFAKYPAVPKGDEEIEITSIKEKSAKLWAISYSYSGTIVLKNGPTTKYNITLPVNPKTIYKMSTLANGHNPCTDEHYQSEGDFWYFWNPEQEGCKLEEGKDYVIVEAGIKRISNTKTTYPEYERLADKDGNVKISLLMGMDDPKLGKDPNKSADINAANFRDIKASLKEMGFKNLPPLEKEEIDQVVKAEISVYPHVEQFTKEVTNGDQVTNLTVEIFFGPSGIDEDSTAFHYYFKNALEKSSIVMYDGHSGLGGHLDLQSIQETEGFTLRPNKSRYQIYFFNSCTSYTYYNSMFFDRKKTDEDEKGTKNLDIMTNGLATYFSVMHDTNLSLVKAVDAFFAGKAKLSYQTIAKQIDSGNLFGINGDEDNPKK